jgi:ribosomal protein S1
MVGSFFLSPSGACAEPQGGPTPAASATPASEHPRDGGIISGKITGIDYRRSIISVNRMEITVMPSTQIQGSDPAYHAITDLKTGMSVDVYTSQIGGKFIAQIITLK